MIAEENGPQRISARDALERVNNRYARIGVSFDIGTIYQKARRKELSVKSINGQLFFDPEEIDKTHFRVTNTKLPTGTAIHHIKTFYDLRQLQKKWGELLDTDGLIDAIEKKTEELYGVGVRYTYRTIERKRRNRTLLCVGYQGTVKNRQYWYPAFQVELNLINLEPHKRDMNPYAKKKKLEEDQEEEQKEA